MGNISVFSKLTLIALYVLLTSCLGDSGSSSDGFSSILPDESTETTACVISSTTPEVGTIKLAAASSTATTFSAAVTGTGCATTFTLNGVALTTTGTSVSLTSADLKTGTNTLVVSSSNSAGGESKEWTLKKNTAPQCTSQFPSTTNTSTSIGVALTLIGTAVDTDGDTITYSWKLNGSKASSTYFTITDNINVSQAVFTPTNALSGSNTVALELYDGVDTTTCSWTVNINSNCAVTSSFPSASSLKVSQIGSTSTSFGAVANDSNCTVSWKLNGSTLASTGNFIALTSSNLTAGQNTVIATVSNGGSQDQRTWLVTKNTAPTCSSQTPASAGNSMTHTTNLNLTAVAADTDNDPVSFAWKFNGVASSILFPTTSSSGYNASATFDPGLAQVGASQQISLEITDGTDTGSCLWGVEVTDPNGLTLLSCSPSTAATQVIPSVGPTKQFTLNATGSSLSYVWKKDGVVLSGATGPSYDVTAAVAAGTYTYRADVTDTNANTENCVWTVKRNTPPTLSSASPVNTLSGTDYKMRYDTTLALSVVGADNESDALSYEWSISPAVTGVLVNTTLPNNTFTPNINTLGTYTISVRAYDQTEYSSTESWTIEVNAFSDACNSVLRGLATSVSAGQPGYGVPVTGGQICTFVGPVGAGDKLYPATSPSKIRIKPAYILNDGADNLFISDHTNHTVWFWNRSGSQIVRLGKTIEAGQFVALLGNGTAGRNSENLKNNLNPSTDPASQSKLSTPYGIAWDSTNHRLWVADYSNDRIVELNSSGQASTVLGWNPSPVPNGVTPGNNTAGNTDGINGKSSHCNGPLWLWFDATNEWLYVTCNASHAIKRMDTTPGVDYGKTYMVVGRTAQNSQDFPCVTASCATAAGDEDGSMFINGVSRVNAPWDITGDSDGNIYWGDSGNRQVRMATTSGVGKTFFASGNVGNTVFDITNLNLTSNISAATLTVNSVSAPGAGTKLDVFGPDKGGQNGCQIYMATLLSATNDAVTSGSLVTVGLSATGGGTKTFYGPANLDCSGGGTTSVDILSGQSSVLFAFKSTANSGTSVITAANGGLTNGTLSVVMGATAAAANKLGVFGPGSIDKDVTCQPYLVEILASSNRVTTSGVNRTVTVDSRRAGGSFYTDSACTNVSRELNFTSTDYYGVLYYNKTVKVGPNQVISLAGYTGTNAYAGGPIGTATFNSPRSIAVHKDVGGNMLGLFVSTGDHKITYINVNNSNPTNFGGSISVPLHESIIVAGTGSNGFNGDGGVATTRLLNDTRGIAMTKIGVNPALFISDYSNFRVRGFNLTTGAISSELNTLGRDRSGFFSGETEAPNVYLNNPSMLAYESSSKSLYYGDSGNGLIRSVDMIRGTVSTVLGTTVGNGNIDNIAPTMVQARFPAGITILNNHLVYTDRNNSNCLIRAWNRDTNVSNPASSFFSISILPNTVSTIAGDYSQGCVAWGTAPANSSGSTAVGAKFSNFEGLTNDGTNLYAVDQGNNCVIKLTPDGKYHQYAGSCGNTGSTEGDNDGTATMNVPVSIIMDPLYSGIGNMFIVDQTNSNTGMVRYLNFRQDATANNMKIMNTGIADAPVSGVGYLQNLRTVTGAPRINGIATFDNQICYGGGDETTGATGFHNITCYDRTTGSVTIRIGSDDSSNANHKGGMSLGSEQEGLSATLGSPTSDHVRLGGPYRIVFDEYGNLYIAERLSNTIRVVRRWW